MDRWPLFRAGGRRTERQRRGADEMGQPGVPTVEQYLTDHMPEHGVLGFDGRVINSKTGESLQERLSRNRHPSVPIMT